jgi:hypothetical protein
MKIIFSILVLIMTFNLLQAQVLKANVRVDYNHLAYEEQEFLQELYTVIEDYFNNYAWTDDEYETDIDISIYIIIETVSQKSYEKIYKSQFQIKSVSGESFYDKEWEFPYQQGYSMEHNKVQFDPICHFLDYYAYLILAGELDTYDHLLGTPYYDAAQDLANRGLLSQYSRGWSNRLSELQKITNIRTRPLREAKPDFFEAAYLLQEGKREEAREYGLKVLEAIKKVVNEQPNNKYLKMFFDAQYVTFAQIFQNDNENLELLVNYDSNHRETYREAMR